MKCRTNDYVLLKNGKRCRVLKGTNKENGSVKIREYFPERQRIEIGWISAAEIIGVEKNPLKKHTDKW